MIHFEDNFLQALDEMNHCIFVFPVNIWFFDKQFNFNIISINYID